MWSTARSESLDIGLPVPIEIRAVRSARRLRLRFDEANGRLKLSGVVQNVADKTIAGLVADTLENVFEVENELAVADEMMPIRNGKKVRR